MNGQKAVSIAQVGQVHFDEWVSITSAATGSKTKVLEMKALGMTATEIAAELAIHRSTVYRHFKEGK